MAARVHLLPRLLSSNRRLCLGRFQTCSLVPKTFSMTLPRTLKFTQTRGLSSSQKWLQSDQGKGPAEKALEDDVIDDDLVEEVDDEGEDSGPFDESGLIQNQWMDNLAKDPKDRSRQIPVETSIAYLESDAYRQTYEGKRVISSEICHAKLESYRDLNFTSDLGTASKELCQRSVYARHTENLHSTGQDCDRLAMSNLQVSFCNRIKCFLNVKNLLGFQRRIFGSGQDQLGVDHAVHKRVQR